MEAGWSCAQKQFVRGKPSKRGALRESNHAHAPSPLHSDELPYVNPRYGRPTGSEKEHASIIAFQNAQCTELSQTIINCLETAICKNRRRTDASSITIRFLTNVVATYRGKQLRRGAAARPRDNKASRPLTKNKSPAIVDRATH
jgi:hypothetical protein